MSGFYEYAQISTDKLIPYANNARTHNEEQVSQIAASINEWGFTDWRFCVENDCYAVTSCGEVLRVCRRQRSKSGGIISRYETTLLKGSVDRYGYRTYRMLIGSKKKHVKGHRSVMNAFSGEQPDKCVNHKSGVKTDNSIGNLEWVTVAENNRHAIETGLLKQKKGINQKVHGSCYMTIYLLIKLLGYSKREVAEMNKVSNETIRKIFNRVDRLVGDV